MNAATIVQKLWNYCNMLRDAAPRFQYGVAAFGRLGIAGGTPHALRHGAKSAVE